MKDELNYWAISHLAGLIESYRGTQLQYPDHYSHSRHKGLLSVFSEEGRRGGGEGGGEEGGEI